MKKVIIYSSLIIALLLGVAYYFLFQNNYSPIENSTLTGVSEQQNFATKTQATPVNTSKIIKQQTPINTKEYRNEKLGFSFNYLEKYDNLKIRYFPNETTPIEDSILSFYELIGVSIQGNNYDSGTDTSKKPICPSYKTCVKKVNKVGTSYFEATEDYMGGTISRKEFPLAVKASLVITYDIYATSDEEKAELDALVDSVILTK